MRLAEAQALQNALSDPSVCSAIREFCSSRREYFIDLLLRKVRLSTRDTMQEARLAGQVEAYEDCFEELRKFAHEQRQ